MNKNEIHNIISTFYKIMCMLLTIPVASCSSESSFSALRRIKTYLRSTMGQERLRSIAIINPLSANPTKWSNTLKQLVGKLPTNCLIVFDHFVGLANLNSATKF